MVTGGDAMVLLLLLLLFRFRFRFVAFYLSIAVMSICSEALV